MNYKNEGRKYTFLFERILLFSEEIRKGDVYNNTKGFYGNKNDTIFSFR